MDLLLAPETRPFAVAALMLVGLIGLEMVALLLGASASHLFDKAIHFDKALHVEKGIDHDADTHNGLSAVFGWVNAGRVPLLILIMLALAAFAATGYLVQALAMGLWAALPGWVASGIAVVAAVPMMRTASRSIARIIPQDETYAVEAADFVGRTAEVTIGPLDDGLPGRVKLRDTHGNWHFPRARAAKGHGPMAIGSTVLLVDRDGSAFLAIPATQDLIPNQ